jgi:tRNA modification GTPase
MNGDETIYALASAPGRAGVAVVRVSGAAARGALETLTSQPAPPPRQAALRRLAHPGSGQVLDNALVLWMPAPRSFTGEDTAELHLHGGRAVIASVLAALSHVPGCRMAEPGEFTRRALLHGRMDLTQVEGLADLINAETQAQQRQALGQLQGHLRALYEGWAGRLLRLAGHMEAAIDFADEDLPDDLEDGVRAGVAALAGEISRHLADGRRGERLRDGVSVAILGAPNVGKSTLLNALARRDVAIVSDVAGTTRDVLEVHLDLGGIPVILADTAGLRDSAEAVESEGIRRARQRAQDADLKLVVADAGEWPDVSRETLGLLAGQDILILNKVDRVSHPPDLADDRRIICPISAKSGAGLEAFLAALTQAVAALAAAGPGQTAVLTRARHREALEKCLAALERVIDGRDRTVDLLAEDLRHAIHHLGRITGRVDVEDYLDVIFRDFCIGK